MSSELFAPAREFTALLCLDSPELTESVTGQLTPLGFVIQTAPTPKDALTGLHTQICDLVVTSEDFGGADAFSHPVLSELAEFPLDLRRSSFVILIGPNRTSQSEIQAFSLSVDMVLRPEDTPKLKGLVGQGLARKEAFYATFRAMEKLVQEES